MKISQNNTQKQVSRVQTARTQRMHRRASEKSTHRTKTQQNKAHQSKQTTRPTIHGDDKSNHNSQSLPQRYSNGTHHGHNLCCEVVQSSTRDCRAFPDSRRNSAAASTSSLRRSASDRADISAHLHAARVSSTAFALRLNRVALFHIASELFSGGPRTLLNQ